MRDDGGMLWRETNPGPLEANPPFVLSWRWAGTLANYLGVGTGELVQSGSVGDGWSRPLRWRAIKPEIDVNDVRRILRFSWDPRGESITCATGTFRTLLCVAHAWLESREAAIVKCGAPYDSAGEFRCIESAEHGGAWHDTGVFSFPVYRPRGCA